MKLNGYNIINEAVKGKLYIQNLIDNYLAYKKRIENKKDQDAFISKCFNETKKNPKIKHADKKDILSYCADMWRIYVTEKGMKWLLKTRNFYVQNAKDPQAMNERIEYLYENAQRYKFDLEKNVKTLMRDMSRPRQVIRDPVMGELVKSSTTDWYTGQDKQLKLKIEINAGQTDMAEIKEGYIKIKQYFKDIIKQLIEKATPEVEQEINYESKKKEKVDIRKFKATSIIYTHPLKPEDRPWHIGFTYLHPNIESIWCSVDVNPTPPVAYVDRVF
jgi:hypothetical protein